MKEFVPYNMEREKSMNSDPRLFRFLLLDIDEANYLHYPRARIYNNRQIPAEFYFVKEEDRKRNPPELLPAPEVNRCQAVMKTSKYAYLKCHLQTITRITARITRENYCGVLVKRRTHELNCVREDNVCSFFFLLAVSRAE